MFNLSTILQMNIKPHMRNNMKKQLFILLAIMVIATAGYAQVTLQSFQIAPNYLQETSLKVANINSATPFKFLVSVARGINSGGGYVSGNCTIKLYYTENQSSDSNIPDDPSSVLLLTKNITSSNYSSNQATLADLDASLPANKQYGKLILRFEYLDNQNINRISYSSTRYGIYLVPPDVPPSPITINSVNKVETILFGTDCGFPHAYGTSYNPNGHMENGVWKFAYDISFTKNNASVVDSDIYWEWEVADMSNYPVTEKQFLVYPYGTIKGTPMNGNKKVFVEANDYLDEYDSKVFVRAKSRSTGAILSSTFSINFTAVNH
jgi:hypothetical protein